MRSVAEFRKENSIYVRGLSPEMEKISILEHDIVNILSNCDHKGRRVLIISIGKLDPSVVTPDSMFRLLYLIHIAAQLEPEIQCRGVVAILDFYGLGMNQIKALTPNFCRRFLTFLQDALPIRLKEIHIIRQPYIFKIAWALFRPFIREKLKKRVFFHRSDMKSLHEYLDPSCLPENYGGKLSVIDYTLKEWYPMLEKYEDYITQWEDFGFAKW